MQERWPEETNFGRGEITVESLEADGLSSPAGLAPRLGEWVADNWEDVVDLRRYVNADAMHQDQGTELCLPALPPSTASSYSSKVFNDFLSFRCGSSLKMLSRG